MVFYRVQPVDWRLCGQTSCFNVQGLNIMYIFKYKDFNSKVCKYKVLQYIVLQYLVLQYIVCKYKVCKYIVFIDKVYKYTVFNPL